MYFTYDSITHPNCGHLTRFKGEIKCICLASSPGAVPSQEFPSQQAQMKVLSPFPMDPHPRDLTDKLKGDLTIKEDVNGSKPRWRWRNGATETLSCALISRGLPLPLQQFIRSERSSTASPSTTLAAASAYAQAPCPEEALAHPPSPLRHGREQMAKEPRRRGGSSQTWAVWASQTDSSFHRQGVSRAERVSDDFCFQHAKGAPPLLVGGHLRIPASLSIRPF